MADIVTRADFKSYMRVQRSGRYNMLSYYALKKTRLSLEKYEYILNNYTDLEREYGTFEHKAARRLTA